MKSSVLSQVKLPGFPNAVTIVTGANDLGDIAGFLTNNSTAGFLVHQGKLTISSFPGARGSGISGLPCGCSVSSISFSFSSSKRSMTG